MKTAARLLALLLFVPLLCHAQSKLYTQLYVFGDSYSDSGAGYIDGNGPTAVVYLAQRLDIPFTYFGDPKTQTEHPIHEGLNFAVSGARTGEGKGSYGPHRELLGRGMSTQVDDFAALVKSGDVHFDAEQTMFFLLGGLNDRTLPAGQTRTNEEALIDTLYGLGARRFMVALLPVKIPQFATAGERANAELTSVPQDMKAKYPDIQIALSNWGSFYDQAITHPSQYGFTNTTDKCAGRALRNEDTTECATPQTYFFYHDGHPSTAAHKVVGDMLYDEAVSNKSSQ
ncbi:SGNH/GDSL hydrolase family protein [Terriglobus roseus]|uniref:Phospholipase/lecithinase/hemolysin n=1 Tax=Terriglobus roseus TaxID=392734 RepID=A0A1G7PPG6_9BACT|nr:SGNH/GDSL hydrolase family protein [Terriglobus roseus]SDF87310.1 Phospholipase/lecithinase/hemolysin [Terriglobus roseus]